MALAEAKREKQLKAGDLMTRAQIEREKVADAMIANARKEGRARSLRRRERQKIKNAERKQYEKRLLAEARQGVHETPVPEVTPLEAAEEKNDKELDKAAREEESLLAHDKSKEADPNDIEMAKEVSGLEKRVEKQEEKKALLSLDALSVK